MFSWSCMLFFEKILGSRFFRWFGFNRATPIESLVARSFKEIGFYTLYVLIRTTVVAPSPTGAKTLIRIVVVDSKKIKFITHCSCFTFSTTLNFALLALGFRFISSSDASMGFFVITFNAFTDLFMIKGFSSVSSKVPRRKKFFTNRSSKE